MQIQWKRFATIFGVKHGICLILLKLLPSLKKDFLHRYSVHIMNGKCFKRSHQKYVVESYLRLEVGAVSSLVDAGLGIGLIKLGWTSSI